MSGLRFLHLRWQTISDCTHTSEIDGVGDDTVDFSGGADNHAIGDPEDVTDRRGGAATAYVERGAADRGADSVEVGFDGWLAGGATGDDDGACQSAFNCVFG